LAVKYLFFPCSRECDCRLGYDTDSAVGTDCPQLILRPVYVGYLIVRLSEGPIVLFGKEGRKFCCSFRLLIEHSLTLSHTDILFSRYSSLLPVRNRCRVMQRALALWLGGEEKIMVRCFLPFPSYIPFSSTFHIPHLDLQVSRSFQPSVHLRFVCIRWAYRLRTSRSPILVSILFSSLTPNDDDNS